MTRDKIIIFLLVQLVVVFSTVGWLLHASYSCYFPQYLLIATLVAPWLVVGLVQFATFVGYLPRRIATYKRVTR
jgi:hypothetical protein